MYIDIIDDNDSNKDFPHMEEHTAKRTKAKNGLPAPLLLYDLG